MKCKIHKICLLFFAFFAISASSFSQVFSISGTVTDSTGRNVLFGASIVVKIAGDTSNHIVNGAATDSLGNFRIPNVAPGNYTLKTVYPGYKTGNKNVSVTNADLAVGRIMLRSSGKVLEGVSITDKQIRMQQNGDTTAFNANAYKTNPDATAEDLVNKMPGVTNDNGTLKVHGEEVKQVLVDGKPYFGDDPSAALKNLPADMIDQIQVYDKASDQSQFTGFDDGQSKKTINIVTKKAAMNGQFGKVYAGYGTDNRYNAGASLNLFDNARRITLLGMSNNVNQQNFNAADLFGITGGGSSGGKGGGGGGMPRGGSSGGSGRGGPASNFTVGQQGGITNTNAFGLNYSDEWSKKIKVSGSYFFNLGDNYDTTSLTRNYYNVSDSTFLYKENSHTDTRNINHRFNFRFEYAIDSMNSLIITPRLTSQYTDYNKELEGSNLNSENARQSFTSTTNASKNLGYTFSNGITYRHRMKKPGRTVTLDLNGSYTTRTGNGAYNSLSEYSNDTTLINQHSNLKSGAHSYSASLAYTEPVGKKGQLLINYAPSVSVNEMDKRTNDYDFVAADYVLTDTTLSNKYTNTYFTQKAGINYRYNGKKASLIAGNDFQYATLSGDETFPSESKVNKTFENVLPNATFNYKFSQGTNLKVIYRTSTVAPSVTQLQDVVDNSNPLQLKTGNPDLSQDYEHLLIAHYGKTNIEKATGFFAFLYAGVTSNYIGNSTFTAPRDTLIKGIFLNRGSQLTNYVNLDGYKMARGFFTYSFVLTKLKCNLGLTASLGYTRTPALINGVYNFSDNSNIGPGVTLSSNISEKVDFTLSYNGSYNVVKNSVLTQSDNNYFSHKASFKFNWMPYKGLVLNTSLDQTFYSGLSQGYNSNYLLWNASVGYKFLKNKSLEAKVSAFDLLKQNTSVSRTVTETYIEDSRTNTLQQYFLLTVTYNIKKFKTPSATPPAQEGPMPQTPPQQNPAPAPAPQN